MGQQRIPKKVYEAIDNYIKENKTIDSEKLADFVKTVVSKPDMEMLEYAYYRNLGNYRIRRLKGSDGLRSYFSNGDKKNGKYVNFDNLPKNPNENDLGEFQKANQYYSKRYYKSLQNFQKTEGVYRQLVNQVNEDNNDSDESKKAAGE